MKFITLVLACTFLFSSPVGAHGYDHSPQHGGIFVEGKVADMEIVAKPGLIQVYVYDHGKPAKLAGATGKVTLLNGAQKTEIDMTNTADKLEAKGAFQVVPGTKGIALVTLPGKPAVVARFQVK